MTKNEGEASSISSSDIGWKYHVFLSFRGEDTRYNFTDNLYHAFRQKGINVFRDKEGLRMGEEISPSLLKAIEESRISVIVFSKEYASSTWCLDELVKILECKKEKEQKVLPVFFDVDPSEVRHQKGNFGVALDDHTMRFKDDNEKVQRWRSALREVANLSGVSYHENRYESQFIESIIGKVSSILNHLSLHVAENPVGLESRTLQVVSLLGLGSPGSNVCMVGVHGIGGIGKTTIAKAIYNLIATQFECRSFIADVRENSTRQGLVELQESILNEMLGENIKLSNVHQGISIMKDRLSNRKVLLVLDDINKLQHLQALAGETNWYGSGSRIIITTRDKHLLVAHGVQRMYELKELGYNEALELFCWNAFKSNEPTSAYVNLSARAVFYTKGIPLAVEIIGSSLNGVEIDEWESTLSKYERNMNRHIYDVLRVSYDDLEYNEKEIFLDIAFFLKKEPLDYVVSILNGCGFYAKSGIRVLEDKSFIKIRGGRLWMHDLIQGMGKEIVRRESERDPSERSRLTYQEDVLPVLTGDMGTSKIHGILLDLPRKEEVQWSGNAFEKMTNLKILIIRNASFSIAPQQLPNSLRLLDWEDYPSSSLPSNFDGSKLHFLRLQKTHPWQLQCRFIKLQNLNYLTINHCQRLKVVPDLSVIPQLAELNLDFCFNLVEIHESVGYLRRLQIFSAVGCFQLRAFPSGNGLVALKLLNLTGCQSIEKFPNVSRSRGLVRLHLSDTSIDIKSLGTIRLLKNMKHPYVVLPGVRIPTYYNHRLNGKSMSFWIRHEFPIITVSFALVPDENMSVELCLSAGHLKASLRKGYFLHGSSYVLFFYLPYALTLDEHRSLQAEIQQDWVRVEVFGVVMNQMSRNGLRDETSDGVIKECGVYVHYPAASIGNISFLNPFSEDSHVDSDVNIDKPIQELPGISIKKSEVVVESSTETSNQWSFASSSEERMRIPLAGQNTKGKVEEEHVVVDDEITSSFDFFNFLKRIFTTEWGRRAAGRKRKSRIPFRKGMRWLDEDDDDV